jgi:hypothetical protein
VLKGLKEQLGFLEHKVPKVFKGRLEVKVHKEHKVL